MQKRKKIQNNIQIIVTLALVSLIVAYEPTSEAAWITELLANGAKSEAGL